MNTVDTFGLSKEQLVDHADKQMDLYLENSGYSTTQKLALTCRILFDNGHDSGLAGQITARGIDRNTFYTQRLGLGFEGPSTDWGIMKGAIRPVGYVAGWGHVYGMDATFGWNRD